MFNKRRKGYIGGITYPPSIRDGAPGSHVDNALSVPAIRLVERALSRYPNALTSFPARTAPLTTLTGSCWRG